jgi:hypothetical protein
VRVYFHAYQVSSTRGGRHWGLSNGYLKIFFLGAKNCVAVSSQVGGTLADCIYLLLWSYDGIRLYSIRLDDWSISFVLVPACTADPDDDWAGTWYNLFWVIPPR